MHYEKNGENNKERIVGHEKIFISNNNNNNNNNDDNDNVCFINFEIEISWNMLKIHNTEKWSNIPKTFAAFTMQDFQTMFDHVFNIMHEIVHGCLTES